MHSAVQGATGCLLDGSCAKGYKQWASFPRHRFEDAECLHVSRMEKGLAGIATSK
jgi:hypothetical protein